MSTTASSVTSPDHDTLVPRSTELSIAGQLILYFFLALLLIFLVAGIYHICTRASRSREDVESVLARFDVQLSAEEEKLEDSPSSKSDQQPHKQESAGSGLTGATSLLPIQPVPVDVQESLPSSSTLTKANSPLDDANIVPAIVLQECTLGSISEFESSTSILHTDTEEFLQVPSLHWTGRVVSEDEERMLDQALTSNVRESEQEMEHEQSQPLSTNALHTNSEDTTSVISDLVSSQHSSSMPTESLSTSFSLDLQEILAAGGVSLTDSPIETISSSAGRY
ncbi:hypothetical protein K474DRAFT_1656023 [Panus rudis PR-1116 ss-1]|nr:hypothetical protein K474DRAFT_1656023 [Panus rudis PR-1116 ss-1]